MISSTRVDSQLWAIEKYLMNKIGIDDARRKMSPLIYYINTGRASTPFLVWLVQEKRYVIGRILMKEGCDSDIIQMLKKKSGIC